MKIHSLLILCALSAAACGRSEADRQAFERAMKERTSSTGSAKPAASAAPIVLAETNVEAMSVSVKLPEGSKRLSADKTGTTYAYPVDRLRSIDVTILESKTKSPEDAEKLAASVGGPIHERGKEGTNLVFVSRPQGTLQTVFAFGKTKSVKCVGPAARLDLLKEICGSLKELT
jgi:hypothetical protein